MDTKRIIIGLTIAITAAAPAAVFAAPSEPLQLIYWQRPDLQRAFDGTSFRANAGSNAGFLIDLEDWAYQYGWREYPELAAYAPPGPAPTLEANAAAEPAVTASAYVVMDRTTGQVLAAHNADKEWPLASLTKLATTDIVLDQGIPLDKEFTVTTADDVGGAKLYVNSGDLFTFDDLMYATLVASANNAANAIARATGIAKSDFVAQMNVRAQDMNLWHTKFVDPTGIEVGNVSTAREWSRFANRVFSRREVRRYTTTATAYVDDISAATTKKLPNTNWMLWKPEYDDIYVMAGKTGFLYESGWNLAVCLRPELDDTQHELLLVLFGTDSRADSFVDARALSEWAWNNYQWNKNTSL